MAYWLFKSEPTCFSFADLMAAPGQTTGWDGVRNFQARNLLRDQIRRGDGVLFYHSSANPPAIAGIAEVVREAHPDPTAFDKKHDHYDEGSDPKNPRWVVADVQLKRRLKRVITLDELRKHETRELDGMLLLKRGNRLSITPLSAAHWKFILTLE